MPLTPQQQYQLILSVIEEAQRLTQKFGLNDGALMLEEFKKSIQNATNPQSLFSAIDQEKLFKKTYKEKRVQLNQLIANIFGFDLPSKKVDEAFKKILSPSEKEIKQVIKENAGVFDLNNLLAYVNENARNYIKLKFGVTREEIRAARTILEKRLLASSAETATTITHIARIAHLLLKDKRPLNFKFHSININGLYKLIKIINGIQNVHLAEACMDFFTKDNEENHLIIRAFFAAEKTEQYCRNPSLLVQTLELMVNKDPKCNKICDSFIKNILGGSKETSVKAMLANNKEGLGNEVFIDFLGAVLNTAIHFKPILDIAMQDLANKDLKISQLQANKETLLRSAFYFGLISPILANIESKLAEKWPAQACQQFRLELSIAFDVMLGLKSADKIAKIKSAGVICPELFDLVISPRMQETVKQTFATIGTQEKKTSSATLGYEADSEETPRRKESSSQNKTTRKPSSTADNPKERASSSISKQVIYGKTRAISFYKTPKASSSQIETSSHTTSAELTKKRSMSALPKKVSNSPASSAVPTLSPKAIQSENTLEGYFSELFACDEERVSQFVLSLVRTKDRTKFSWGVQVLNEASNKHNKQIADVLINNLSESELLNVFDELLKGEKSDSWCRGNRLLPILIQQYMAKKECREFKDFLWTSLFSLAKPISNIQVQQRVSMVMTPDSFTAETGDIISLQKEFSAVMKSMLASQKFPPLMQKVLCLAYSDLAQRKEIHNKNDNRMRIFLGFVLLRFINPIIQQEANSHSMNQNLKMWYMKILPAAIQSFSSPLSNTNTTPNEEKTLQETIFDPITKNESLRAELFGIMRTGFNLVDPSEEEQQHNRTQLADLDIFSCIGKLNDLLKAEEFSGLNFKSNGGVTPRSDLKSSIMSFFSHTSSDDESDELSPTPTHSSGK